MSSSSVARAPRIETPSEEQPAPETLPERPIESFLAALGRDLHHAVRSIRQKPAFSAAAVLTLALGIGSLTGFFSLVHGVVFQRLPYPEPRAIAYFDWKTERDVARVTSLDAFVWWRDRSESFATVAAYEALAGSANLRTGDQVEPVPSLRVTQELFTVLGVAPARGRTFTADSSHAGSAPEAVLSDRLWRERFGGDPRVVGRQIQLGAGTAMVVGVMPAHFRTFPEADVWTPLPVSGGEEGRRFAVIGRLRDGVSYEEVQSEADVLFAAYRSEAGEDDRQGLLLGPYKRRILGDVRGDLLVLFAAGGLVFLICCINLFNLCFTNEVARAGTTAVRVALGAGRWDVFRHAVSEYAVLATVALVIGSVLAAWVLPLAMSLSPHDLPRADQVELGPAGWVFSTAAGLLAVAFVGTVPVVRLAQLNRSRNGWYRILCGCRGAVRAGSRRVMRACVVGEVAFSLAVLVPAFTLIEAFLHLRSTSPGFDTANVATFQVPMQARDSRSAAGAGDLARALERDLLQRGDVVAVATASSLPLETGLNVPVTLPQGESGRPVEAEFRAVSPSYFEALGIPLRGRGFREGDRAGTVPVVIVNEALAREHWRDGEALGATLWIAKDLGPLSDVPRQVVGVAGDVRDVALGEEPRPTVYVVQDQVPAGLAEVIRQSFPLAGIVKLSEPGLTLNDVRASVRRIDPLQAVTGFRPLAEVLSSSLARERFYAVLLGVFAALTLVLTGTGLYGVATSYVGHRCREIGLRMVLGADEARVQSLVLGDSLQVSLNGTLLGVPLAFCLYRLIDDMVPGFRVEALWALAATAASLVALTLIASLAPAVRATRIEPAVVLRYE